MARKSRRKPWIYITSKVRHAKKWQLLAKMGIPLSCTWIWMNLDESNHKQMAWAWTRMIRDCVRSKVLIIYLEPGETLKGGLGEIGAVLGSGGKVFTTGIVPEMEEHGTDFSEAFTRFPDFDSALEAAMKL